MVVLVAESLPLLVCYEEFSCVPLALFVVVFAGYDEADSAKLVAALPRQHLHFPAENQHAYPQL